MKILKVLRYLAVFSTTVPLMLAALFLVALCGMTTGTGFKRNFDILIEVMEVRELLSPSQHKEFWKDILSNTRK